jgi:Flp pilus assembly protein TadD
LEQYAAAITSLSRAESLSPTDAEIPYAQATIFARFGRNAEAVRELKRTLEIDPENPEARQLLQNLSK